MLGYIMPAYGRLSPFDFALYRKYYCEGCHHLRDGFGLRGTLTVNYDMTFNTILLNGIAGTVTDFEGTSRKLCVLERPHADSDLMRAMAAYTLIIAKWELADDENDKPSARSRIMSEVLSKAISRAVDEYPDFDDAVGDGFRRLLELEESDSRDAISIGREFGRYLAVPLRTIAGDRSSSDLDDVFANLTAAVYVMDAIDDLDDDFMDGTFNPYLPRDGVFVNSRDFISSHLYDLTSDVNSVIGSVQGPYSRARAGMKAHASLCDNIVYYGIPESASKVLRGESEAKASVKNLISRRKERMADRSQHPRRVVGVAYVHGIHLLPGEGADPAVQVAAVLAASRSPAAAAAPGIRRIVLGDAYPDIVFVDAEPAGPAFAVTLIHAIGIRYGIHNTCLPDPCGWIGFILGWQSRSHGDIDRLHGHTRFQFGSGRQGIRPDDGMGRRLVDPSRGFPRGPGIAGFRRMRLRRRRGIEHRGRTRRGDQGFPGREGLGPIRRQPMGTDPPLRLRQGRGGGDRRLIAHPGPAAMQAHPE